MTKDTVPTPAESDLSSTLEEISDTGRAQCRLCDHVVEGDSYGEIFEKLAEHGEQEHEWTADGWDA